MSDSSAYVKRVDDNKSNLERILGFIPQYHGYQSKEKLRESDRLVREEVSRRLGVALQRTEDSFNELARQGKDAARFQSVRLRMDSIREGIRHAPYGFAGMFDPVKVKEPELQALIDFDASLLGEGQKVEDKAGELSSAVMSGAPDADLQKAVGELGQMLVELESTFTQRKSAMLRLPV